MNNSKNLIEKADDPFDLFNSNALKLMTKHDLPADFINESLSIIKNTFGESLLRNYINTKKRGTIIPHCKHPLGNLFQVAGENQIVELMELAVYLKKLYQVPNLDKVIENMKAEELYLHCFLQLSFAYRFKLLGAKKIKFEPSTNKGRLGDISFKLSVHDYIVDCYVPNINEIDSSHEIDYSLNSILDSISEGNIVILLKLKEPVTVEIRKKIKKSIITAVNSMGGNKNEIRINNKFSDITIKKITKDQQKIYIPKVDKFGRTVFYKNADWAVASSYVPKKRLEDIRLGKKVERDRSFIFVWKPPQEKKENYIEDILDKLIHKISKKISQISVDGDTNRIIIVSTFFARERDSETSKMMSHIINSLRKKHKHDFAIIIMNRVWTGKSRYNFVGYLLDSKISDNEVTNFFHSLNELEANLDVIKNWR